MPRARARGGDQRRDDVDEAVASLAASDSPERAFERAWAITVIEHAFAQLREEALAAGRVQLFEALAPYIVESAEASEYAVVGAQMGMRANTVAVAVHRLRQVLRRAERHVSERGRLQEFRSVHLGQGGRCGGAEGQQGGSGLEQVTAGENHHMGYLLDVGG